MNHDMLLVPLDGSTIAESVIPYAVTMARATRRGLILLSVLPLMTSEPSTNGSSAVLLSGVQRREQEATATRLYLESVTQTIAADDLPVEIQVIVGVPEQDIAAYAQSDPRITGVALATHARHGLSRLLFGSVAEHVIQTTTLPVLLVRANLHQTAPILPPTFKTIMVPLDGTRAAEEAMPIARALVATESNGRLILLSVLHEVPEVSFSMADALAPTLSQSPDWINDEYQRQIEYAQMYLLQLSQDLHAQGVPVITRRAFGSPPIEITHVGKTEHADLLVMTTHGRTGMLNQWQADVARRVLHETRVPLLLVRVSETA